MELVEDFIDEVTTEELPATPRKKKKVEQSWHDKFNEWWGVLNQILIDANHPEVMYLPAATLFREDLSAHKAAARIIKDREDVQA